MSPRVSIGLPVFDGEPYVSEAIASVLAQTWTDFELIISDNASTDATGDICREHARRDPRIRYERNAANLGAAPNFNRLVELARGEYFKWLAHDDVLAPDYLEKAVAALDEAPDAACCAGRVQAIDADGRRLEAPDLALGATDSSRPSERFRDQVLQDHLCYEVFGLMRLDVLRRTPLLGHYVSSDRPLLAELALHGRFVSAADAVFFARDHPDRSVRALPFHLRAGWFDTSQAGRVGLPHWRLLREYHAAVGRVTLDPRERRRCRAHLVRWLGANGNWARLAVDFVVAMSPRSAQLFARSRHSSLHARALS